MAGKIGGTSPPAARREAGGTGEWEHPAPWRWELVERRPGAPAVLWAQWGVGGGQGEGTPRLSPEVEERRWTALWLSVGGRKEGTPGWGAAGANLLLPSPHSSPPPAPGLPYTLPGRRGAAVRGGQAAPRGVRRGGPRAPGRTRSLPRGGGSGGVGSCPRGRHPALARTPAPNAGRRAPPAPRLRRAARGAGGGAAEAAQEWAAGGGGRAGGAARAGLARPAPREPPRCGRRRCGAAATCGTAPRRWRRRPRAAAATATGCSGPGTGCMSPTTAWASSTRSSSSCCSSSWAPVSPCSPSSSRSSWWVASPGTCPAHSRSREERDPARPAALPSQLPAPPACPRPAWLWLGLRAREKVSLDGSAQNKVARVFPGWTAGACVSPPREPAGKLRCTPRRGCCLPPPLRCVPLRISPLPGPLPASWAAVSVWIGVT